MFLRRLVDHVRSLHWTMIFIDFVIVVVGVLLAFQITEWSKARDDARARAAALVRLQDETEISVTYFRHFVTMFDRWNAERTEALRRLTKDDWKGADAKQMTDGIMSIDTLPMAAPPRSAYDEIISAGMFAKLGDARLRDAITGYYARLTFLQGQIAYLRRTDSFPSSRSPYITSEFNPKIREQRSYVIDFERASKDPEFIESVVDGNHAQLEQRYWWNEVLIDVTEMCHEIARVSDHPCKPSKKYRR